MIMSKCSLKGSCLLFRRKMFKCNALYPNGLPLFIFFIAIFVELWVLFANEYGIEIEDSNWAENINRIIETICLSYIAGFIVYWLTTMRINKIEKQWKKRYVLSDIKTLYGKYRQMCCALKDDSMDEIEYRSLVVGVKNNTHRKEGFWAIPPMTWNEIEKNLPIISEYLAKLLNKEDCFSFEELNLLYKIQNSFWLKKFNVYNQQQYDSKHFFELEELEFRKLLKELVDDYQSLSKMYKEIDENVFKTINYK